MNKINYQTIQSAIKDNAIESFKEPSRLPKALNEFTQYISKLETNLTNAQGELKRIKASLKLPLHTRIINAIFHSSRRADYKQTLSLADNSLKQIDHELMEIGKAKDKIRERHQKLDQLSLQLNLLTKVKEGHENLQTIIAHIEKDCKLTGDPNLDRQKELILAQLRQRESVIGQQLRDAIEASYSAFPEDTELLAKISLGKPDDIEAAIKKLETLINEANTFDTFSISD